MIPTEIANRKANIKKQNPSNNPMIDADGTAENFKSGNNSSIWGAFRK